MVFIVASVHTKTIVNGLNIQAAQMAYDAISKEEAIGKHLLSMCERLPEHELFQRPIAMSIEDAQQVIQPDNAQ